MILRFHFLELLITGGRHPASNAFALSALGVVIGITLILIFRSFYQSRYWGRGIFPPHLKYSVENLMQAQICMAALMVRKDRSMMLDKMLYIDNYFRSQFRDVNGSYRAIYTRSLSNPIQPETVAAWLEKHKVDNNVRLQFVQFLMNVSIADGVMNRLEFVTISKFIEALKLDQSILNDFVNANYERKKRQQEPSKQSSQSDIQKHLAVLGLSVNATKDEIKKTYRRLAKMYHPDRFQQENQEVQMKAKVKFQELQQAYDWLSTR